MRPPDVPAPLQASPVRPGWAEAIARRWPERGERLPLRLVLGGGLVLHSAPKVLSARGHENIRDMLQALGIPAPGFAAWADGLIGLVGGVALLAGLRVRAVSTVIAGEVAGSLLMVWRKGGYPDPLPGEQPLPGAELSLFYLASALALAVDAVTCPPPPTRRMRSARSEPSPGQ